jgi:23S rRNA pseudouridine2604 synthase
VARKLTEEGMWLEQEIIVGVEGQIIEDGLELYEGRPLRQRPSPHAALPCELAERQPPALCAQGHCARRDRAMCAAIGLTVVSMRRLRLGRVSLAKVPEGQWRYLMPWERF